MDHPSSLISRTFNVYSSVIIKCTTLDNSFEISPMKKISISDTMQGMVISSGSGPQFRLVRILNIHDAQSKNRVLLISKWTPSNANIITILDSESSKMII